jgi:glycyl-tRNA synthetase alpha subunit
MEIFVRLFIWIVNRTYGKRGATSLFGANPMDQHVLQEYEVAHDAERNAERHEQVVANFKSSATPVQGAVDYCEMNWSSFDRVIEGPEQFTFYSGRNIAKVIEKKQFINRLETLALRRMIRRHVAMTELLDD